MAGHRVSRRRTTPAPVEHDAITAPIPVPRAWSAPPGDAFDVSRDWMPPVAPRSARRRWLVPPLVAAVMLVVIGGAAAYLLVQRPAPISVPATPAAVAQAPAPTEAARRAAPATSTKATPSSAAGCPASSTLVREFARKTTYGAGAHAVGPVRCAGGFAVVRVMADNTPDGVSTIYRVGPPLTYLAMGTGPICSDDPADGKVVVPRSAARTLTCIAGPRSTSSPSATGGLAPTLGAVWASNQKGFGQVRPGEVYAGGDPTGLVTGVRWTSWGGATATGTGTGSWTPPGGSVSDSVEAPVRIIASNLGTCHGKPAYLKVTWYFPTKGETGPTPGDGFSSICDG